MNVPGSDIAMALAAHLSVIPEVRVHAYMPDSFLPPGIVIQQPTIQWDTEDRTFCTRKFLFPLAVAVPRNHDSTAQAELDRLVTAIEERFQDDPGGDIQFARLLDARPVAVSSQGTDYPGYLISVEVVA
jgi:hypothetical protein